MITRNTRSTNPEFEMAYFDLNGEDEIVRTMILPGDLHQPFAFEHMIDLLLYHDVFVARGTGHRLVRNEDPIIDVTQATASGMTRGFDRAPPKMIGEFAPWDFNPDNNHADEGAAIFLWKPSLFLKPCLLPPTIR